MTRRKSHPMLLGGTLELDISRIAARIIDEHGELVADGYTLKTPVTVTIRRDTTLTLPIVYTKRFAGRSGHVRRGWMIETSVGGMFGAPPSEDS